MHWESYEKDITGRRVRIMKKQIQLYYDPEDEMYKTLISAKNKTYLLDVCYKFSMEFYKCQMKEGEPDSEEVICYLIAMMYLLRQGGTLPGIAARGARGTGEWLQEQVPGGKAPGFWEREGNRALGLEQTGKYSSADTYWSADTHHSKSTGHPASMHPSSGTGRPTDMNPSSGTSRPTDMYPSSGMSQPMDMYPSSDMGQLMDMRRSAGRYQSMDMDQPADMQSSDMHQSADMQSAGTYQSTDMQATNRYQAEDGHKGDSGNWQADGNPALASVMADVEIK